jgi:hypothetical protein
MTDDWQTNESKRMTGPRNLTQIKISLYRYVLLTVPDTGVPGTGTDGRTFPTNGSSLIG